MVVVFKILNVNSNIGSFEFGRSEILGLRVKFSFKLVSELVIWEVPVECLYLFFTGQLSREWSAKLQYKQMFSLLLLSFSSLVNGP